jgi:hypothetical protein
MKVLSPSDGVLEWRVEEGAQVAAGLVLGWVAGPGRGGLLPLTAGASGRLTWRRSGALETVAAGEPSALIDGDDAELRSCRDAERDSAHAVLSELEREIAQLVRDEPLDPLRAQLLGPQRRGLEARWTTLRMLVSSGHD